MTQEEQTLVKRMDALAEELGKIRETETKGMNIFSAVGMARQEVKHSAFFAWLLTPYKGKQHDLDNAFLKAWLELLFNENAEGGHRSNSEILAEIGFHSINDFIPLLNVKKINVLTEECLISQERRIDILIECVEEKIVIVIENKVGTTTHDAQLQAYEDDVNQKYKEDGWKKIYVYLTPEGDLPYELELKDGRLVNQYKDHWCVYSYTTILKILKNVIGKLGRSEKDRKLKFLMEDYVEMVDTQILKNNPELFSKCKSIARQYKNELELLMAYVMDGLADIINYCKDKLDDYSAQFGQISFLNETDTRLEFITEKIRSFFGESFLAGKDSYPVLIRLAAMKGDVDITLFMENTSGNPADWTDKQRQFATLFHQTVEGKNRFCSLVHVVLLPEVERYGKLTEERRMTLDGKLDDFFGCKKMKELRELLV